MSAKQPWDECWDEQGNQFFYNTITGESAWELPAEEKVLAPPPPVPTLLLAAPSQTTLQTATASTPSQTIPKTTPASGGRAAYAKAMKYRKKEDEAISGILIAKDNKKDIWLSKEELHARKYKLTRADRMSLMREQRNQKRAGARAEIARAKEVANQQIWKLWESAVNEAENSGHLNCSWKGFRVIHPRVYEMKHITVLRLVGNALSDVPRSIGYLMLNLKVLSLSCNGMTFVPKSMGRLTRLTDLNLQSNCLRTLPAELCNLTNLTHLDVTSNMISSLPAAFGQLRKIARFSLERNCLGELPKSFENLCTKTLILNANNFKNFPMPVSRIRCLQRLSLNQNGLTSLPDEISELEQLQYLSVCNNSLQDLPLGITELRKLKTLWLDWNGIEELPEGFRFIQSLKQLKMEGNPMRYPTIELIQKGNAAGALQWCQKRHERHVRFSKRNVVEALQRTFRFLERNKLAEKALFEPDCMHDNGKGVEESYYAFQISAVYEQFLPAIEALPPEKRHYHDASWFFPYKAEHLTMALTEYVDSAGTSAGLFDKTAYFRGCCCVDKSGQKFVCIPPMTDFLCKRKATLVKMSLATKVTDQMRKMKRNEKKKEEHAVKRARRHAQHYIDKPATQVVYKARAEKMAEEHVEGELKETFVSKRVEEAKHKKKKEDDRREKVRDKLQKKLKERIRKLEKRIVSLTEQRVSANKFETEVIVKEINECEAVMAEPPETVKLNDLDLQDQKAEVGLNEELELIPGLYKPRGEMKKKLARMTHRFKELVYDSKCRIEEEYVVDKEKVAGERVRHQFKCMRKIIKRWSHLAEQANFTLWADWTRRRIDRRVHLKELQATRARLRADARRARDALRQTEYAKWEKQTDPFTGGVYYVHKETGEEVFEIPLRDYVYR